MSIKVRTTVLVEKRTTRTIEITGVHLLELLRAAGHDVPRTGTNVEFSVPGGGDWSNTSIDISEEHPVTVSWIEDEQHEEEL
jgi:hypothetical protein